MVVSSPSPESKYHPARHFHLRQICKHSPGDGAQLEAHPREANSEHNILSVRQAVDDGVLVGGHGVDAGLLDGHIWVDPRTVRSKKPLQGSLQILSGNPISLVRVNLRALMKADLKILSLRAEKYNQCPFKRMTRLALRLLASFFLSLNQNQMEAEDNTRLTNHMLFLGLSTII